MKKIVAHRKQGGKKMYKIRWEGYGAKDDTWEDACKFGAEFLETYRQQVEKDEARKKKQVAEVIARSAEVTERATRAAKNRAERVAKRKKLMY